MPSPTIPLDETWTEPEMRFNAGRRSDFRRARRRARTYGELHFETLCPASDQFDRLLDEAVEVENRGWKGAAGTAILQNPAYLAFFRAFFRAVCAEGDFRVSFLRLDGQAIAMQLGIVWADRYWLFKIGHDTRFDKCSPGTLLMLNTIGWAATEKLKNYELLGRIEPWITALWTRDVHECVLVRTYPFNLRGLVALGADGAVWLRARLKRMGR